MTTSTPPGMRVRFVLANGVAGLMRAAFLADTDGVRDAIVSAVGNVRVVHQRPDGSWPTLPRRWPWLDYEWVARHHPDTPPTSEHGALDGDRFVSGEASFLGAGTVDEGGVITTPETRTATLTETFTGHVDGAAWPTSRWVATRTPAGGGATIEADAGVLLSGTGGASNIDDQVTVRPVGPQVSDVEVAFMFALPADTRSELRVGLRTTEEDLHVRNGAVLIIDSGRLWAKSVREWAYTDLADHADTITGPRRARVILARQSDGDTLIRARTWADGQDEPSEWHIDTRTALDATIGWWGLAAPGLGSSSGARNRVVIDDVRTYDRPPASDPTWWGTR